MRAAAAELEKTRLEAEKAQAAAAAAARAAQRAAKRAAAAAAGLDDGSDSDCSALGDGYECFSLHLVYGELTPEGFRGVLGAALRHFVAYHTKKPADSIALDDPYLTGRRASKGLTFVDLGSGEGVPPIVAALTGVFGPPEGSASPATASLEAACGSVGIELVPRLHKRALDNLTAAKAQLTAEGDATSAATLQHVHLICGDFIEGCPSSPRSAAASSVAASEADPTRYDWRGADIVFLNGTCYEEDMLADIWKRADGLRFGSVVVLTTHKCPSPLFKLVDEGIAAASWGSVSWRAYQRQAMPAWVGSVVGHKVKR